MTVYKLETMPASSEEYYSDDVLVKYIGTTTADFINDRYYESVYDEDTGIYGWEEATEYEYFVKVFTRNNLIYLLTKLTDRLRNTETGE